MDKAKIKRGFAEGLAVIDGNNNTQSIVSVTTDAFYMYDDAIREGLNEVFRMVLAEENTDNIILELKTIVDEAFERVSDEILETFED